MKIVLGNVKKQLLSLNEIQSGQVFISDSDKETPPHVYLKLSKVSSSSGQAIDLTTNEIASWEFPNIPCFVVVPDAHLVVNLKTGFKS